MLRICAHVPTRERWQIGRKRRPVRAGESTLDDKPGEVRLVINPTVRLLVLETTLIRPLSRDKDGWRRFVLAARRGPDGADFEVLRRECQLNLGCQNARVAGSIRAARSKIRPFNGLFLHPKAPRLPFGCRAPSRVAGRC